MFDLLIPSLVLLINLLQKLQVCGGIPICILYVTSFLSTNSTFRFLSNVMFAVESLSL